MGVVFLDKILSAGTIKGDEGELIEYVYCRGERLPEGGGWNNYIKANFIGWICIYDHGGGVEYAICLLQNEIDIRKTNMKHV
jgi:hypothetical protein